MKIFLTGLVLCCAVMAAQGQYIMKATIRGEENIPLAGATATWKEGHRSAAADSTGMVTLGNLPGGVQTFVFTYVGYRAQTVTVILPQADALTVVLEGEEEEHEEEVIVRATRTSRTISNIPTRIEVISGEELEEKGNMKPGEIRMLLNESTGIQAQQTSATSYNSSIRIQGLEGRYTQLLKDGYPLYSGFSGGLSIMQITPLDLRQAEVIKGSSSTLYGGGAIAGLVNLVSKTPGEEREISFLGNGTSAGGLDLSGFYSQRYGKAGLTLMASRNSGSPYDPAGTGLTALPKFERYTVNPRLFLYGEKTTADVGVSYITEDRIGGNIDYIKNGGSGYFEKNNTDRVTTQAGITHRVGERSTWQLKNSYTRFHRTIAVPGYTFEGVQQSSFSEITWDYRGKKGEWITGANVLTDDLSEERHSQDRVRDYHYNTFGLFVQNTWTPSETVTLETGVRGDWVKAYGFVMLPRLSALFRVSPSVTTRIGGGFGYKTPTVFTEEAERIQFRNVLPIDIATAQNERSVGGNWDINFRSHIGDVRLSLNHLFFYTRLNHPLEMVIGTPASTVAFMNAPGFIDTKGMETNLRLLYGGFKLFIGYTYTDANTHYSGIKRVLPLTARHRLNNVLMYEIEGKLKLGLEGYWFSRQRLSDGTEGRSYWLAGFMAEKLWKTFSLFVNFENITNTRQTRFGPIYSGTIDNPVFQDIYAPVEGFVVNGGIKVRL